ncbi:MAG: TraB/VirB10 family protein [Trichlorobacter sp.]|nr:TraB/VirB10 family protein [Trichlorobacter sp.]
MKEFFKNLKPKQRRLLVFGAIVAVAAVSIGITSSLSGKDATRTAAQRKAAEKENVTNVGVDSKIAEKTMMTESAEMRKRMDEMEKIIKSYGSTVPGFSDANAPSSNLPPLPPLPPPGVGMPDEYMGMGMGQMPKAQALNPEHDFPLPEGDPMDGTHVPPPPGAAHEREREREVIIGDIAIISGDQNAIKAHEEALDKKKEKPTLYLPTGSFTEATLLSGIYAPTSGRGRSDPAPALIRIKTPSQLPNEVKANLKGCFLIGKAVGALADERAHIKISNISCISRKGDALIDQSIEGYAIDEQDGFVGVGGRVVARLGAVIARSLLAGFVTGLGDGLKQSTETNTLTSIGNISQPTVEPDKIALAGLGSGASEAARHISTFMLDLAKETIPVIEVLPGKKLTVVITQGVELNVKPLKTSSIN